MSCIGDFLDRLQRRRNSFFLLFLLTVISCIYNFSILKSLAAGSSAVSDDIANAPLTYTNRSYAATAIPSQQTVQPQFILHIGPHKSATTSIQCTLYRYRDVLRSQDSIVFLGKVDDRYCELPGNEKISQDSRIQKLTECIGNVDCWGKLTAEWDGYRRNGLGVVLSKEGISDLASPDHSLESERALFWPALEEALSGWNVTVVVTYRRFFEWLPSAYNQHAFQMRLQKREPWPQSPQWPQTLEDVVSGVIKGLMPPPYPFVDKILQRRYPSNWNVHVLNMHRTPDVVRAFLCDEVLKVAKHTCSTYEPAPQSRQSPSEDLIFDYLNVQALQWGWMKPGRRGLRARATRSFVQDVLKLSPRDFPSICPSRSLLRSFLDYSVALEKTTLGAVDVEDHTEKFWKSSRNLCTVNATAVLLANQSTWKHFYASL